MTVPSSPIRPYLPYSSPTAPLQLPYTSAGTLVGHLGRQREGDRLRSAPPPRARLRPRLGVGLEP